jgi:radical SAM superfamily enzyme YgiQ (UPF0313 family)
VHNDERPILENMDLLPFVSPVYKRDLDIRNYFNGYLKHPYLSLYTGRGCKSRCTFCLWPQTIGGHRYRKRSVGHVIEEIAWAKKAFPEVKEFFFDDDTLTDDLPNRGDCQRNDPQPANDEATLARRRRISSLPARARCGALISGSCFGRLAASERRLIASPMLQVLCLSNVRFVPLADIQQRLSDVRFTPKSGHWLSGS